MGSDTTERLHFHFSLSCIGEGNGNPLQCSCLENPRDGGAWWAAVYGVTQSRTRLKWLSSSSSRVGVTDINFTQYNNLVQFSCSVVSDSLQPHELQHARPPCPSPSPGVHSDSRPSSPWCYPAISSSVVPSPCATNPSQHQSLFQWVNCSHEVAKVLVYIMTFEELRKIKFKVIEGILFFCVSDSFLKWIFL